MLALSFIVTSVVLCGAAALAIIGLTHVSMSGSDGVERDGLHRGVPAPRWSLPDADGHRVDSPCRDSETTLQLIVFADHSLKSFPSVVDGLATLTREATGLQVVIVLRDRNDMAVPMLRLLGLGGLPVVTASSSLYGRYNVRVMPWAMFIDSSGRVRSSSLVNHAWQIDRLWRLARVPLATQPARSPRLRRRAPVLDRT